MNSYIGSLLAVFFVVHIVFLFAVLKRRNDYADVFWGPGFVVSIGGALIFSGKSLNSLGIRELLIIACVSLWSIRLFWHIGLRTIMKDKEDIRYLNWRQEWGQGWILRSYLQVFILQAVFMILIASPVIYSIEHLPRETSLLVYLGVIAWIFGFVFESISDAQLKKFKQDPSNKGKMMTTGLWSYSRHPNYFGEVVQWWGVFLMAIDENSGWLILSPSLITFLILKVSGVPMLEKLMEGRPGFEEYKRKTPIFFPWFPKSRKN